MHITDLNALSPKKLKISKPSTTVLIDRLEENGFVYKVKSDSDRRSAHVHLTGKGVEAFSLHRQVHVQFSKGLTANLSEAETNILVELLNKALNHG